MGNIHLREYWDLLVDYLRPQWPSVLLLAVLLLVNIALQLVNPQVIRTFIDVATGAGPAATAADETARVLLHASLLFIGVAVAQQLVALLAAYLGENVGWTSTNALRADVAEHCLALDMSFHNARTPGEMIERIDGDMNALSNFFSQFVIQVLGNSLLLVGVLAFLYREDWRVGSVFTLFVALALTAMLSLRNIAVPHWEAERQASADQFGFLEERLAGTEDIRSCGAKAYVMRRFTELMRGLMQKSLKAGLMVSIMVNTTNILFAVGNAVAFALGAYLYLNETMSIGTVVLVGWYSNMLMWPIRRITFQVQELQRASAGIARIRELLGMESRIQDAVHDDGRPPLSLPAGALALAFQSVTFGYDDSVASYSLTEGTDIAKDNGSQSCNQTSSCVDENPADATPNTQHGGAPEDEPSPPRDIVLHDLSFELRPGAVLGLLGRTGSGKTTLTRLIFRLYDPDRGGVYLGRDQASLTDVRQVPLQKLRQRVAMVTQNIQLFQATVRDNLTFFDRDIPDERILQVLRDLGLYEWYEGLADGLDTELESGGSGLSAGEAQLLAFTRIFLQDPGLVILDEASSRLDPATEHLIERAVDRLVRDRTAIIIAHRLSTVQRADDILILEEGRVCERGARTALVSDPTSRFYGLMQTGMMEEVLA
jgi:ABC-type multidrug transport system fused ATPase/permease subunit